MLLSSPSGNRIAIGSLLVSCLFFFCSNDSPVHKRIYNGGSGRWTGTLRSEQKFNGISGHSERTVVANFTNAIPLCYIEDLGGTPADDKGTGTHTFHSEGIVNGIKFSTTDCSGTGEVQLLSITFNEDEKNYSIGVNSTACNGKTINHLVGTEDVYGPDITTIDINNEPLGSDPNVLAGTKTETVETGGGPLVTTITWHLVRVQDDVELIITPVDYNTWLPKPGINEMSYGSEITINLKLQGKNGKPLNQKATSFELRLSGTSREPGMTINYPLNPLNPTLPDLRFLPQPNSNIEEEFQFMTINCTGCTTASVKVDAFDGGGYSTLTAVAVLADKRRITGNLLVSGGPLETLLPKRNGSIIAQSWLDANGNPGDYDDNEKSKNNSNNGDGLTAYEEYRGVIAEGVFKRLDPQKKELGVAMPRSVIPNFSEGINWFKTSSEIEVVKFYIHEIAADRRLNKNYATGHFYDQYALVMVTGPLPPGVGGRAYTNNDDPAIPAQTPRVVIDLDQIHTIYMLITNGIRVSLPFTEDEMVASTIAHEISHGVNVAHHGDLPDVASPLIANNNTSPVRHIYDVNGTEITTRPFTIARTIGSAGSQESGDLSCFMAYNPYCVWAYTPGVNGTEEFRQVPSMSLGRLLCKSDAPTGLNTMQGYFGKATNGYCISQIRLK